jgi:hypothetical protein
MGLFTNLTTDNLEATEDRLGGNFDPIPSDAYAGVITNMYAGVSKHGAQSITLHAKIGDRDYRETLYITNRKGENFYTDKNDKTKKVQLPGFTTVDDICMFASEKPLSAQDTETKQVKVYDPEAQKEVPKPVEVLIDCVGQPIGLAILRQIVDKQKANDSGKYVNTGETRTENVIDKALHPETKRTINEYKREVLTSEYHDEWVKRNQNKDRNRSKGSSNASSPAGRAAQSGSGAPGPAGAKHVSLFN